MNLLAVLFIAVSASAFTVAFFSSRMKGYTDLYTIEGNPLGNKTTTVSWSFEVQPVRYASVTVGVLALYFALAALAM